MTAIVLHGAARRKFGGPFHLDVQSPSEAFHALCRLKKGFREFVREAEWRIIKGPTKSAVTEGRDCTEGELPIGFGAATELHVIPVPAGAGKGKGIGKIVAGVAIIALSILSGGGALGVFGALGAAAASATAGLGISAASIALAGVGLVVGGISQLKAGNPKAQKPETREDSTQRTSTLFNGPVNVGELGQAIPLVFSDEQGCLVGTVVASAGLSVEQVPVT